MNRWVGPLLPALLGLVIGMAAGPSQARQSAHILIDHDTGAVLDARNADATAFPASLTKMMTLYLTFRALDARQIKPGSRFKVSARAAGMPPTKLGLKPGSSIEVEDAIMGLVTKSANDAAAVLAEGLGGSESRFAVLMTRTARQLGMKRTVFRNASGLPDAQQRSTARDLARLATRLIVDFPHHYRYFSRRSFTYAGRTHPNHNRLMQSYAGMDGLKTGYTRASGFNLAASAERDGRRLVAVVLGGSSAGARDRTMADLLDAGFKELERRPAPALVAAVVASPSPPRPTPPDAPLVTLVKPVAAVAEEAPEIVVASLTPEPSPLTSAPVPRRKVVLVEAPAVPGKKRMAKLARKAKSAARPVAAASLAPAPKDSAMPYGVQVGAFQRPTQARLAANQALKRAPDLLRGTFVSISSQLVRKRALFRATLVGLAKDEADEVCRRLQRHKQDCMVIRTAPLTVAQR